MRQHKTLHLFSFVWPTLRPKVLFFIIKCHAEKDYQLFYLLQFICQLFLKQQGSYTTADIVVGGLPRPNEQQPHSHYSPPPYQRKPPLSKVPAGVQDSYHPIRHPAGSLLPAPTTKSETTRPPQQSVRRPNYPGTTTPRPTYLTPPPGSSGGFNHNFQNGHNSKGVSSPFLTSIRNDQSHSKHSPSKKRPTSPFLAPPRTDHGDSFATPDHRQHPYHRNTPKINQQHPTYPRPKYPLHSYPNGQENNWNFLATPPASQQPEGLKPSVYIPEELPKPQPEFTLPIDSLVPFNPHEYKVRPNIFFGKFDLACS